MLSLGTYPAVSLAKAREKLLTARKQIADGIDPSAARKAKKQAKTEASDTFEAIGREWYLRFLPGWTAKHAETIIARLEGNVFPWLGERPIADIKTSELLTPMATGPGSAMGS